MIPELKFSIVHCSSRVASTYYPAHNEYAPHEGVILLKRIATHKDSGYTIAIH